MKNFATKHSVMHNSLHNDTQFEKSVRVRGMLQTFFLLFLRVRRERKTRSDLICYEICFPLRDSMQSNTDANQYEIVRIVIRMKQIVLNLGGDGDDKLSRWR